MREIKLVHLVIIVILGLLSVAILQWTKFPQRAPTTSESSAVTAQPTELPLLPQNELYKFNASPSFRGELPPFKESPGTNQLEPKGPTTTSRKAEL